MEGKFKYHFDVDRNAPDIDSTSFQRYTVDRGINSSRTVQFMVEGMQDSFIDLSQCYLKTSFRVVNEDGSELSSGAPVFPTENYGTNLWSQVNISLNNTPLPPGNDYPYTAFLIDLLGASPEARAVVSAPLAGFSIPNYGSSRISDALSVSYTVNSAAAAKSKTITVYDRIHSDFLTTCSQVLPSRMQLGITLTRSKDYFVLGETKVAEKDPKTGEAVAKPSGAYKIEILSASLFIKRVWLNPAARSVVEGGLVSGGKLLYQRLHTLVFSCAKGTRSWNWYNCFNNVAPRRAYVALVSQEGYYGSLGRVGNYLESAGVSSVSFRMDGREVMAEPYRTKFRYEGRKIKDKTSDAYAAFAGLHRTIGSFYSPRDHLGVTYPFFVNGATIYAVSLEHSEALGPAPGTFDVNIEFETQTSEPLMVIVMGEYPNVIPFDANRNIVHV